MMLLVLDKDPMLSARYVPDKLKLKQLLELCQLICSCGYSDVYKPMKQGKEIMEWIKKNECYTKLYFEILYTWCLEHINLKQKTKNDFLKIFHSLPFVPCSELRKTKTAIFRYSKEYKDTKYATNSELPIDVAIEEYTKYLKWKGYEIK